MAEPVEPRPAAIQLDQFLKREGWVATGGEAKRLIQAGEVLVNGAVETRRKHRVVRGDRVRLGDHEAVVDDLVS